VDIGSPKEHIDNYLGTIEVAPNTPAAPARPVRIAAPVRRVGCNSYEMRELDVTAAQRSPGAVR